ncbi:MAG TPA: DUF1496 domain-containing protein [Afipia sp.]
MTRILSLCLLVCLGLPAVAQTPLEQKSSTEPKSLTEPKSSSEPKASVEIKTSMEPKLAPPMCVYKSRNYSEGATVCVQKAMMQTCTIDGAKAVWTNVTDDKLTSRCVAPARRLSKYQQRAIWNRQNIRREITPATDSSPFCFYTNGKRFCE